MNQEKLRYIVQNPSEINADVARELEELTRSFPYFSLPFALLTRYYAGTQDYRYEDTLHKAALRVQDRKWLYDFVNLREIADEAAVEQKSATTMSEADLLVEGSPEEMVENAEAEEIQEAFFLADEDEVVEEVAEFEAISVKQEPHISEPVIEAQTPDPLIIEAVHAEIQAEPVEIAIVDEKTEEAISESHEEEIDLPATEPIIEKGEGPSEIDVITLVDESVSEDAVFEEIQPFVQEKEIPVLMDAGEKSLELLEELELSPSMIEPAAEFGQNEEPPAAEPERPAFRTKPVLAVYNIEDYYPADADNGEAPSDFFSWLNRPAYTGEKPDHEQKRENKKDLIERFIKQPQSISRPKSGFFNPADVAKKSEQFPDDIVTETLAGVYLKQENYSGAIRIYEKLVLKFPEKKAYFAALIQKIKEEHQL